MIASCDDAAQLSVVLLIDDSAVECLKAVRDHGPEGAYIAAGFVRNRFWDSLYPEKAPDPDADIDVIYFDTKDVSKETDAYFETRLTAIIPLQNWQVRNQARMHVRAGHAPFHDIAHALMHWPEVATAIGVRMNDNDELHFLAPFGISDLYDHILRITPIVKASNPDIFDQRLTSKGWRKRWPRLQVIY